MTTPHPLVQRLRAITPTISAGAISADLLHLGRDLERLQGAGISVLHFDVMDGCFVPQLTVGAGFVKGCATPMIKDVHLMVADPVALAPAFVAAGADLLTIHPEGCADPLALLRQLARLGEERPGDAPLARGVGVMPDTPIATLEPLLEEAEMVVLLAVDPQYGNHPAWEQVVQRWQRLQQLVDRCGREVLLCLDGGVTLETIARVASLGPDLVVSGSALFAGGAVEENGRQMVRALHRHHPPAPSPTAAP